MPTCDQRLTTSETESNGVNTFYVTDYLGGGIDFTWYRVIGANESCVQVARASSYSAPSNGDWYKCVAEISGSACSIFWFHAVPPPPPPAPVPLNDNVIACSAGQTTVAIQPMSTGGGTLIWSSNGWNLYEQGYLQTGEYYVKSLYDLTIYHGAGPRSFSFTISNHLDGQVSSAHISLSVLGQLPPITPSETIKICSTCSQTFTAPGIGNATYKWIRSDSMIPLATTQQFTTSEAGGYAVITQANGCSWTSPTVTLVKNIPPVANAGPDRSAYYANMSATGSGIDSDGSIVAYNWSQISGTPVTINNSTSTTMSVTTPPVGTYVFRLTVTDDNGDTGYDDITIYKESESAVCMAPLGNCPLRDFETLKTPFCSASPTQFRFDINELNSYGGLIYKWYKITAAGCELMQGANGNSFTTSLIQPGVVEQYKCRISEGASDCYDFYFEASLSPYPPPINVVTSSVYACGSGTTDLEIMPEPGYHYIWKGPDTMGTIEPGAMVNLPGGGGYVQLNGSKLTIVHSSTPQALTFTVDGLLSGSQCQIPRQASLSFAVASNPEYPTLSPTLAFHESKYSGAVFCALDGIVNPVLTASGGSGSSTYEWYETLTGGAPVHTGTVHTPAISINATTDGIKTYYVGGTLRNSFGCSFPIVPRRPISVKLLEYSNIANAGPDKELFTNDSPVELTPNTPGNKWLGNGIDLSLNSNQEQTQHFHPDQAGTGVHAIDHSYLWSYSDTNQKCETTHDQANYTVYIGPRIEILGNEFISKGNSVTLVAVGDTYLTYQWYGPDGIIDGATGSSYIALTPGVYSLDVTKGQVHKTVSREVPAIHDNVNHITTFAPQKSGFKNNSPFHYASVEEVAESTSYFDDLGRPMQSVITQASPGKMDIVQPTVYDELGRERLKYIPFSAENNGRYKTNNEIIDEANQKYIGIAEPFYKPESDNSIADDTKPYSQTIFQPSPLNRIIKQGAPGEVWQPTATLTDFSDKSIKKQYVSNAVNEVLQWTYVPSTHTISAKNSSGLVYYAPNSLYVTKTFDEHNNLTIEYTDKEGRVVLKRMQVTLSNPGSPSTIDANKDVNYASTYYIYDDLGNLVVVIQPEGVSKLTALYHNASASLQETFLIRWAFRYKHDSRKRMTEKWVPGMDGPVYMVYDNRDRLVLTQDANQKSVGTKYWTFTKYDELNRPVLTGIKDTTAEMTQADMQAHVDAHYQKSWAKWGESFIGNAETNIHGYSNKSYPTTSSNSAANPKDFLTVTYYDNYTFRNSWNGDYSYADEELSAQAHGVIYHQEDSEFGNVKGLVTGTMVKVLDGGVRGGHLWLSSVNYYDDKYRTIQNITENHTGSLDRSTILYDFTGKVLTTKTTHSVMWKDQVGVDTSPNSLTKRSPSNSWGNAGAASMAKLPAGQDGWMEVVVSETNTIRMVGLSDVNIDADYTTIDYAFYLNGPSLYIRENGVQRAQISGGASTGTILRIERSGTMIRYYRNGSLVYPSATPSSTSLMVDASLYSNNSSLTGIRMSFASPERVIVRRFEYDHAGRLTATWHKINTAPEILIAKNEFNELGQLVDKKLHSTNSNATNAKQSVDYRYNIRGWLTSINNASLSPQTGVNDDAGDLFGFELAYNNGLGIGSEQSFFNGNISAIKWSNNLGLGDKKMNAYTFGYDQLNRLKSAAFSEKSIAWTSSAAFNEDNLQYDLNGNIRSLDRKENGQLIDQLTYAYGNGTGQTNQLISVTDASNDKKGFKELNTALDDYKYDANGNLVRDQNKLSEDLLTNGDFNSGSTWTLSGETTRAVFQNGELQIAGGNSSVSLDQSIPFQINKPVLVVVEDIQKETPGTIEVKLGNAAVNITGTGTIVLALTPTSSGSFSLQATPGFSGKIKKVSVYSISIITYNYLNLPETVVQSGNAQLKYIYDATGRKLYQKVLNSASTITKTTDYLGEFFYENDTLKFINHEEGRVVMTGTSPEYQYHLKDHLGNVRLTFTAKTETDAGLATYEPANVSAEQNKFRRLENARKVFSPLFDKTNDVPDRTNDADGYAQRLSGGLNEKYGYARSLSVMPGDTVKAEVYAKFVDQTTTNWSAAFAALMSQVTTASTGVVLDDMAYNTSTSSFPFPNMNGSRPPGDGPKAYLNWLIFDRSFTHVLDMGFKRLSDSPKENGQNVAHEKLESGNILITEPGYVYVYLSNDEETPLDVYFDDFKVEHKKSPVVQMDDYYPFGLTFNSYSRENAVKNNYLYNGIERQDELDLGWDLAQFRAYDPAIARFMQIDPVIKEHESPYTWNTNNPILYPDPTGADSTQRAQAVARAQQFVNQNCANTYGFVAWQNAGENNVPGPSADKVDCSGLVRAAIMATDEGDPYYDGQSHQKGVDKNGDPIWKNGVEILVDNPDFEEISLDDAVVGTVLTLNNTDSKDPAKDLGHTGIISKIERNEDGSINTLIMIDSGGKPSSGKSGPRYSNVIVNGENKYYGERITGAYKWDTKPDKK